MKMRKTVKIAFVSLFILALGAGTGGFSFAPETAQAKSKTTKWQQMLERNGVDRALWEKYLPKVSRKEYIKVTKALRNVSGATVGSLGPEISVGVRYTEKSGYFKIDANKTYRVSGKDQNGNTFTFQVEPSISTRVEYYDNGH